MTPLGLYVHWPFCARICPYCDFTVAKNRAVDEKAWADALAEDLKALSEYTRKRPLRSIYFGGGTPSLVPANVAERVFRAADDLFGIESGAELTVEANPDDAARFKELSELGFNRLSLGVQSVSDASLTFLGRNHDAREARDALIKATGMFPSVSADMIYALPGQTPRAWEAELREVLSYGMDHLSLYQLTIEPGTPFGLAAERGRLVPSPNDLQADLYELTGEITQAAGFPAYEVSNHARPGSEAVHNSLYWQGAEWLAIGPGAHGRLGQGAERLATEGAAKPKSYAALPLNERLSFTPLTEEEVLVETLAGGLRPVAGLCLHRLGDWQSSVLRAAEPFIASGHLEHREGRLAATPSGRLLLDYLTTELTSALPSLSV
ncbi:radical SAM family heme chaperone HemW [Parvularcula maris]|uniref:Heme chaperone HemW n=1 Tax=Parvularcula maris TaxID=2965077 RepID=A0A9X2LBD7_9PROT|nr:radical SAM family heme chaperone HemW [Parvularcula maris]